MGAEYVVTIEVQLTVEDEDALLAATTIRPASDTTLPRDLRVPAALERLLEPNLADIPGVEPAVLTWHARVTAKRRPHTR